jgi:hypothetical protein
MKRFSLYAAVLGTILLASPIEATRRTRMDTPTLRIAGTVAAKYGVPAKLLKALCCQESSCGENPVPRRETSKAWARRAKKVASTPQEFEALMHSYGATQLSGLYTFLEYGVPPHELLDDETNLEIAAARLTNELKACRGSSYCAAARWNGGPGWQKASPKVKQKVKVYAASVMRWQELV